MPLKYYKCSISSYEFNYLHLPKILKNENNSMEYFSCIGSSVIYIL